MTEPALSPGVLKRLGRTLADVLDAALEHADLPTEGAPAAASTFDQEARAWLAEFERRHEARHDAR